MKNKKMINTVIVCVVLVGAIALLLFFLGKKTSSYEPNQIENLKETKLGDLPEFGVALNEAYSGAIVNSDIEKMTAYEFDATFDNGWEVKKNHYIGIRVKDAFESLEIKDYKYVKFVSQGLVSITYGVEDITEDTFFIIKKDGKLLSEDNILGIMSFDKDYNYSVEGLYSISIIKEG